MSERRADEATDVLRHYEPEPLKERLLEAVATAGIGPSATPEELAAWDQFHLGGLPATVELAEALAPAPGDHVLDLGSGLGGPARLLAARQGCRVTGIDLSGEFVDSANALSELAGMPDQVHCVRGDVTAVPFDDASFDHAWTIHVAMNVADRTAFYREARRVLKPGGRFAIYDVVEGDGEALTFPVPWATDPSTSHLVNAAATRALLADAGFEEVSFEDRTEATRGWLGPLAERPPQPGGAPAGLAVAMGPRFAEMTVNLARNLVAGRVGVVRTVVCC
jgi:SAM-dependent methyltransferase